MAGEENGTLVLVKKGSPASTIVGQGDFTFTYGGTPIDISTKDGLDWVSLMDGALSSKQIVASGTLTYNDDASYEAVKAEAFTGTLDDYEIEFVSGEKLAGKFMPNAMADNAPLGDRVTTTITFSSSGTVTRTAQP